MKIQRNVKSTFTLVVLIATVVVFSSFSEAEMKKKPKKQKIEIREGTIKINKKKFTNPWTLKMFTNAFGKEDRIDPGINDIYTYDDLGVILYKNPSTEEVSDFNIYVGDDPEEDYSFIPKMFYQGNLYIEGKKITNNTSLEELLKYLPDYHFEKSIIGAYRGEYQNLYIYVQFDVEEKNIYWFSIGIKD
jgi:hypothetical protein